MSFMVNPSESQKISNVNIIANIYKYLCDCEYDSEFKSEYVSMTMSEYEYECFSLM